MTTTHSTSPEWYNENALRAYPIAEDAKAGSEIPAACIVDMSVVASDEFDIVFVSSFYLSQTLVSVSLSGLRSDGSHEGLLTCARTRDESSPYEACAMDAVSGKACGVVVFGDMSDPSIPKCAGGPIKVSPSPWEGRLAPSAVMRMPVDWITRVVDDEHASSATGIVDLSGNNAFTTSLKSDSEGQYVQISLNSGYASDIASPCNAVPSLDSCGMTPVRTINGVKPDPSGLITLRFV